VRPRRRPVNRAASSDRERKRDVDRLSTIVAVADALKISSMVLLPGPFRTTPRQDAMLGTAPDAVPAIESAMLRYDGIAGLIGVPERPIVSVSLACPGWPPNVRCAPPSRSVTPC